MHKFKTNVKDLRLKFLSSGTHFNDIKVPKHKIQQTVSYFAEIQASEGSKSFYINQIPLQYLSLKLWHDFMVSKQFIRARNRKKIAFWLISGDWVEQPITKLVWVFSNILYKECYVPSQCHVGVVILERLPEKKKNLPLHAVWNKRPKFFTHNQ